MELLFWVWPWVSRCIFLKWILRTPCRSYKRKSQKMDLVTSNTYPICWHREVQEVGNLEEFFELSCSKLERVFEPSCWCTRSFPDLYHNHLGVLPFKHGGFMVWRTQRVDVCLTDAWMEAGCLLWQHSKVELLCRWTAHPPRVLWGRGYMFSIGQVRATSERKLVGSRWQCRGGSRWQCRGPNKYLDSQRKRLLCLKGIAVRGPGWLGGKSF